MAPYDEQLQQLYAQARELNKVDDGRVPGENIGRIQKWGDINPVNPPGNIAVSGGIEQIYVDVGPFPDPIPIRLDANLSPPAADVVFGSKALQFTYRLVWNVGQGSISREFRQLPRQVNARSLQVFAKHQQQILEPQQQLAIWATPVNAPNPNPLPLDFEEVSMAIGVGTVAVNPPPRLATHVTCWALATTNLQVFLQFSFNSLLTPSYRLPLFNQVSNAPSYIPPQPLPHDAVTEYRLTRAATTAAENFAVVWCR